MAPIDPPPSRGERGSALLRRADFLAGVPLAQAACLWRRLVRPPRPGAFGSIGVLCPGAIGDVILLTGLLDGLRAKNPEASIELVLSSGNAACAGLLAPGLKAVAFPVSRPHKILAHARAARYDLFIDACQWARVGSWIQALSGAGLTVGFVTRGQWRGRADLPVPHDPGLHEWENFLNLGRAVWPDLFARPRLAIGRSAEREKIVYCHMFPAPGPGRGMKLWPKERWARLIAALLDQGLAVRLTGSGADAAEAEAFLRRSFPSNPGIQSLAGKRSLCDLAGDLARGAGLVSVNTGVMHLGAAVGLPTVGLCGPTNPARWGALGPFAANLLTPAEPRAYLDLGFEYPRCARNNMGALAAEPVLERLLALIADEERTQKKAPAEAPI